MQTVPGLLGGAATVSPAGNPQDSLEQVTQAKINQQLALWRPGSLERARCKVGAAPGEGHSQRRETRLEAPEFQSEI